MIIRGSWTQNTSETESESNTTFSGGSLSCDSWLCHRLKVLELKLWHTLFRFLFSTRNFSVKTRFCLVGNEKVFGCLEAVPVFLSILSHSIGFSLFSGSSYRLNHSRSFFFFFHSYAHKRCFTTFYFSILLSSLLSSRFLFASFLIFFSFLISWNHGIDQTMWWLYAE